MENTKSLDCNIQLDGLLMERRVFRYPSSVGKLAWEGLMLAQRIAEADPGLKSATLERQEDGAIDVIIDATEAGHWVSPSPESGGLERQAALLQQLGSLSTQFSHTGYEH